MDSGISHPSLSALYPVIVITDYNMRTYSVVTYLLSPAGLSDGIIPSGSTHIAPAGAFNVESHRTIRLFPEFLTSEPLPSSRRRLCALGARRILSGQHEPRPI